MLSKGNDIVILNTYNGMMERVEEMTKLRDTLKRDSKNHVQITHLWMVCNSISLISEIEYSFFIDPLEEIKEIVWLSNGEKSLGPNDFNIGVLRNAVTL